MNSGRAAPRYLSFLQRLRTPRISYALFYFVFFSFQAVVLGFFPLHCKELGFSDFQIAAIASLENIASLTGPLTFSFLIVHVLVPIRVLFYCALISAAAFLPLIWTATFGGVFILYLLCLFFNRGVMSLVNTWAVRDSVEGFIDFGRVRLWGSVGFIAFMMVLGIVVDRFGISSVVSITAVVLFVNALAVYIVPAPQRLKLGVSLADQLAAFRATLRRPQLRYYIAAAATLWAAHGAFFTYFSIHLNHIGWSATDISVAWTVGVVAEILVFIVFGRLESWFGAYRIFVFSIGTMMLRCVLISLLEDRESIMVSQVLHGFSFGSFYISSLRLCHELFPDVIREHGQALLIAMGGGVGAFTGRVLSGGIATVATGTGGYSPVFVLSAVLATVAIWLSLQVSDPELGGEGRERDAGESGK